MYKGLLTRITTGWNIMRVLRFLLAAIILISAIKSEDVLIMTGGGFLMIQSLLGLGCCSSGKCNIQDYNSSGPDKASEIVFDEIKH